MSSLGTVLKLFNPIPFTFRSQEEKEASTAIKYLRQASGTEREDEALSHVVNSLRTFYAKKTDTQKAAGLLIVAAKIQGARAHNNKPIMMRKASRLIVAEAESAGPKVFEDALKQARDHYTTKSKVKNISYWISMLGSGVAIIGAILLLCGTISTGGALLFVPVAIALWALIPLVRAQSAKTRLSALPKKEPEILDALPAEKQTDNASTHPSPEEV